MPSDKPAPAPDLKTKGVLHGYLSLEKDFGEWTIPMPECAMVLSARFEARYYEYGLDGSLANTVHDRIVLSYLTPLPPLTHAWLDCPRTFFALEPGEPVEFKGDFVDGIEDVFIAEVATSLGVRYLFERRQS